VYRKFNADTHMDCFTGFPEELYDLDTPVSYIITVPTGGPGPLIKSSEISKNFKGYDEDLDALISSIRTQSPIMHQTTNLIAWIMSRNSENVMLSNGEKCSTTGSNAGRFAKLWLTTDGVCGTNQLCTLWNKFDTKYVYPQTDVGVNNVRFPLSAIANIDIRYWCTTQAEYLVYQYKGVAVAGGFSTDVNKVKFVFFGSQFLSDVNNRALALLAGTELPYPIYSKPKSCNIVSFDGGADQPYNAFADQYSIWEEPSTDGAGNYWYDVVFVLTDWNASLQGQGFNYEYSIPVLNIDTTANNFMRLAGVPVLESAGTWIRTAYQSLATTSARSSESVAQDYLNSIYGDDTEYEKAFLMFMHAKFRFMDNAAVNTTQYGGAGGTKIENGFTQRAISDVDGWDGWPITAATVNTTMRTRDIFGAYVSKIAINGFDYTYSNMTAVYRFALATKIREPYSRSSSRTASWSSWQRFIIGAELSTALAQLRDTFTLQTALPIGIMKGNLQGTTGELENRFQRDQDQYLTYVHAQLGMSCFLERKDLGIPNRGVAIAGSGFDSYAVVPMVYDSSARLMPWYEKPNGEDIRDPSAIVNTQGYNTEVLGTVWLNGMAIGIQAANTNGKSTDMKALSKFWRPNLATLFLFKDPQFKMPNQIYIWSMNPDNLRMFDLFCPILYPSCANYYEVIRDFVNAGTIPGYAEGLAGYVEEGTFMQVTGDTLWPDVRVVFSENMAGYLLSHNRRIFQSDGEGSVAFKNQLFNNIRTSVASANEANNRMAMLLNKVNNVSDDKSGQKPEDGDESKNS
jgi:hypothetical protein